VADAAAGGGGGLRHRHRRAVQRAAVRRVCRGRTGHHAALAGRRCRRAGRGERRDGNRRQVQGGRCDREGRPALLPPDRGGNPAGRPEQGQGQAGLGAQRTTLKELVAEMVQADFTSARRDALVKLAGFQGASFSTTGNSTATPST
jgi:hypothetical protein